MSQHSEIASSAVLSYIRKCGALKIHEIIDTDKILSGYCVRLWAPCFQTTSRYEMLQRKVTQKIQRFEDMVYENRLKDFEYSQSGEKKIRRRHDSGKFDLKNSFP